MCSTTSPTFTDEAKMAESDLNDQLSIEPAAKRGKASCLKVCLQVGLAGRSVSVSVPSDITVSDLRAQFAFATPDFEHEMVLILGDREVHDTEKLSDLHLDAEILDFTAVRDEGKKIREELKRNVRNFDQYDIDRLMREGDPDGVEELWGLDLEHLYRQNDEIIDQLDVELLKDLEAFYRLKQRKKLHVRCLGCCCGTSPSCVVWDLQGEMHVICNY